MKAVLPSLAFLQIFATLTAAATTADEANAAVSDFCHERVYAEAIIAKLNVWLATATTNVETTAADARKLQLAASRYINTEKWAGFAALSAIATAKATEAAVELAAKQPSINKALTVLNTKMAELATMEALTKTPIAQPTRATDGGTAAVAFSGSVKVCQATVTPKQTVITKCDPAGAKHSTARAIAEHIDKLTSIAIRSETEVRLPPLTLKAELQGTPDAAQAVQALQDGPGCHIKSGGTNNKASGEGVGLQAPTFTTKFTPGNLVFSAIQGSSSQTGQQATEHDVNLLTTD
uniref:Variant surface glycoprotein 1125.1538 n=1 Tax=Trypanosoma brucei TaxID=5691 RepID=A0A1J0R770_9TRYP|nr:variant surface glycoprotein 1125.1538 [Trypanosoma brucei]